MTKIHAIVDALAYPRALSLTQGRHTASHKKRRYATTWSPECLWQARTTALGALVAALEGRGITPVIPSKFRRKPIAANRVKLILPSIVSASLASGSSISSSETAQHQRATTSLRSLPWCDRVGGRVDLAQLTAGIVDAAINACRRKRFIVRKTFSASE